MAPVRSLKWRLVLFFAVETLAIATMILLLMRSGEPHCREAISFWGCGKAPSVPFVLAIIMILGELAFVAATLRTERPVWGLILALGILAPVFGVSMGATVPLFEGAPITETLAAWHMAAGVPLLVAGVIGGVHAALARRRLAHEHA